MDYKYWDNYYKQKQLPFQPSKFAEDIVGYLDKGARLVELGCGNGRDSIFFQKQGINVVAIDQSKAAIEDLKTHYDEKNIEFIADDFVNTNSLGSNNFKYVYSRFTIHSISAEQEETLIGRVYKSLKKEGLFFIETRSVEDDLYGLGEKVGRNAYIYGEHYRRFIAIEELKETLEKNGFEIIYAESKKNWAIYKEENPMIIRIVAKK